MTPTTATHTVRIIGAVTWPSLRYSKAVLATLYVAIRDLTVAIQPIIPASAGKLLDQMEIPAEERSFAALEDEDSYGRLAASGFKLGLPSPIFPRLDMVAEG